MEEKGRKPFETGFFGDFSWKQAGDRNSATATTPLCDAESSSSYFFSDQETSILSQFGWNLPEGSRQNLDDGGFLALDQIDFGEVSDLAGSCQVPGNRSLPYIPPIPAVSSTSSDEQPKKPPEFDGKPPDKPHTPLQIIHIIGTFMRIWSVFSMYHYISQQEVSVTFFIFSCLVPSSIIFLVLQKPWKGRSLSNSQVVPSVINGGIMALYFILWGKGLKSCGPLRAIMAEYAGAVLGVLSTVLYGRRGHVWKKVGGLIAMMSSFFFFSQGWATATYSPFSFIDSLSSDPAIRKEDVLGVKEMVIPISAGILSALRRVIARRVSLKNQQKRRLHAITITSATCFLFPLAIWDMIIGSASKKSINLSFSTWAYLSTVLFGIILIFYIDNIAEERLHLVVSSPRHLMVAGGCIIIMEIAYTMDFSLLGFLFCSTILGFGIFEATSLDRVKKDFIDPPSIADETFGSQTQTSPLPS